MQSVTAKDLPELACKPRGTSNAFASAQGTDTRVENEVIKALLSMNASDPMYAPSGVQFLAPSDNFQWTKLLEVSWNGHLYACIAV